MNLALPAAPLGRHLPSAPRRGSRPPAQRAAEPLEPPSLLVPKVVEPPGRMATVEAGLLARAAASRYTAPLATRFLDCHGAGWAGPLILWDRQRSAGSTLSRPDVALEPPPVTVRRGGLPPGAFQKPPKTAQARAGKVAPRTPSSPLLLPLVLAPETQLGARGELVRVEPSLTASVASVHLPQRARLRALRPTHRQEPAWSVVAVEPAARHSPAPRAALPAGMVLAPAASLGVSAMPGGFGARCAPLPLLFGFASPAPGVRTAGAAARPSVAPEPWVSRRTGWADFLRPLTPASISIEPPRAEPVVARPEAAPTPVAAPAEREAPLTPAPISIEPPHAEPVVARPEAEREAPPTPARISTETPAAVIGQPVMVAEPVPAPVAVAPPPEPEALRPKPQARDRRAIADSPFGMAARTARQPAQPVTTPPALRAAPPEELYPEPTGLELDEEPVSTPPEPERAQPPRLIAAEPAAAPSATAVFDDILSDTASVREALHQREPIRDRLLSFARVALRELLLPALKTRRGRMGVAFALLLVALVAGLRQGSPVQFGLASMAKPLAERSYYLLEEEFRSDPDAWSEPALLTRRDDGTVGVGEGVTLYRPSLARADYEFTFTGLVERGALNWAVRAADGDNYYAFKMVRRGKGKDRKGALIRWAVIRGKPALDKPEILALPFDLQENKFYRIEVQASQDRITTVIDGNGVDSFTDSRLKTGGVGFFAEKGEAARIQSLTLSGNEDTWGRFLGWWGGFFQFLF